MKTDIKILNQIYLLKAVAGDAEAFGKLFDNLGRDIYRFILFKVSLKKEVAEDLSSQTFLKLWEIVLAQKEIKDVTAFTYQMARNLVIDYYRSQHKEELPLLTDIPEETLTSEIVTEFLPSEIEKLLNQLNTESKEIVWLKYVEGLSVKEICQIVNKSSGAVRIIIHRAKQQIRKISQSK